jgi:hypothetical protein
MRRGDATRPEPDFSGPGLVRVVSNTGVDLRLGLLLALAVVLVIRDPDHGIADEVGAVDLGHTRDLLPELTGNEFEVSEKADHAPWPGGALRRNGGATGRPDAGLRAR